MYPDSVAAERELSRTVSSDADVILPIVKISSEPISASVDAWFTFCTLSPVGTESDTSVYLVITLTPYPLASKTRCSAAARSEAFVAPASSARSSSSNAACNSIQPSVVKRTGSRASYICMYCAILSVSNCLKSYSVEELLPALSVAVILIKSP